MGHRGCHTQHPPARHGFDKHIEVSPGETSLSFLLKIYRNPKQQQQDALPHENPKLGAIAMGSMSGQDFAAMLDPAILRSQGNGHNVPQIELRGSRSPADRES